MAKTVGDLLIKLGVDGLEGVTALKSALRTLGQASNASDKQLEGLRKEIFQVAKAVNVSQQSIRGQIDAFKGLKAQATIGSTVYKRLGKDIDTLTQSLDRLSRKEDEVAKKPATTKQLAAQFTSAVPEKTTRQLQAQQEMLQKSAVSSVEYTQRLVRLNAVTQEFTRSQQRQAVVAGNIVAMTKAQAAQTLQSSKVNIENTHTTAALKQKIAELVQDLDHIDVGSKEYITTSSRLKEAQQELNQVLGISSAAFDELSRAQERSERRARKLADIQQYYGTSRTGEGQAAQRAGGFRDPATGAMIARGTRAGRVSLAQQPMREISGLYRSIGDIGMSGITADIDRMGKSYQEVTRDIKAATAASNGSINSLQAQRTAFAQLRAGLDPTSQDFRELGKEIEKVDRRLERLNKRRRRPTLGGIAQGLGGIAAGGVFGGPEGAFGAAVGGAFGGIQGVAAGAALGAQVKMLREALGATSEYAAELQKLEIALKGVTGPEYPDALKAAADVTRDFNVPIAVSTKGITRLSAAVIGAGGPVADAATTFQNVTAAIKATGGSAQDVQSAITAMVQVFSKGKVSAEELSGQLGERLPGAVTLFAEANKMTLPELQKNLKAGTVGLNELMNFIRRLGEEFDGTARQIAASNEEAGARLTVAFDNMKAKVGAALLDTGAGFQDTFGKFIKDITPAMVKAAEAIAGAMSALARNLKPILAGLATFVSIITGAALVSTVTNLAAGLGLLGGAAKGAATGIGALTASMALNPLFAGALAVSGIVAGIVAVTNALGRQKRELQEIAQLKSGQTMATLSNEERQEKISATQSLKSTALKELRDREASGLDYGQNAARMEQLRKEIAGYDKRLARLTAPVKKKEEDKPFEYKSLTGEDKDGDGGGAKSTLARRIEQAQKLEERTAAQLRLAQSQGQIGQLLAQQANERALLESRLNKLIGDGTNEKINQAAVAAEANLEAKQELELQKKIKALYEQAKAPLDAVVQRIKDKVNGDKMYKRLIAEGVNPALAEELVNIDKAFKAGVRKLEVQIENLEATKLEAELNGKIVEAIEDQIEALKRKKKELEGEKGEAEDTARATIKEPTFMEGLEEAIENQEDALEKLINPLNQVKEAANAIGEAFKASFRGIINGSMTAREALASFFQSIADHFADMAAQIAAEALKLAALQFVKMIVSSFAGAAGGGGGGYGTGAENPILRLPSSVGGIGYAEGGYVQGGFKAFNQGGVVSQPTLGMVGEGGEPEYIIPQSKMRESMARYSRGVRGPGVIPDGTGASAIDGGGGTAVAAPIDVRYTVERINSVDYVTADQFQRGLQQAAAQGATQGEQRALTTLRQNTSQRRRIGL